jgi:uncharacterized RDD family membrane protein YckC
MQFHPAPLQRRLAAAVYDGLLLIALWMACTVLVVLARSVLHRSGVAPPAFMQALYFFVGLGFFGWFWTHGGQTLGMRVWRLRVQRPDGAPLRWPIAALRYAAMLLCWALVLTPALLQLPRLRQNLPYAQQGTAIAMSLVLLFLALRLLDARRRAPQDWIAGTEVVLVPSPAKRP